MPQSGRIDKEIKNAIRSLLVSADGPRTISYLSFQLPIFEFDDVEAALLDMARSNEVSLGPEGVMLSFRDVREMPFLRGEATGNVVVNVEHPDNPFLGMPDQQIEDVFAQLFSESEQLNQEPRTSPRFEGLLGGRDVDSAALEAESSDGDNADAGCRGNISAGDTTDSRPILTADMPLPPNSLPTRLMNYAIVNGIKTWGQLLNDNLAAVQGIGAKALARLDEYLVQFAKPKSSVPQWALRDVKFLNSDAFYFNQLGLLCTVSSSCLHAKSSSAVSLRGMDVRGLPLSALSLHEPTERRLLAGGLRTVGDIIDRGDEGLLRIRSFGKSKLLEVNEALDSLLAASGSSSSGQGKAANANDACGEGTDGSKSAISSAWIEDFLVVLKSMEIAFHPSAMIAWLEEREKEGLALCEGPVDQSFVIDVLSDGGLVDDAVAVCKGRLHSWSLAIESDDSKGHAEAFSYPDNVIWMNAVESVFAESDCFLVDQERHLVTYRPLSIDVWPERAPDDSETYREYRILNARLDGCTLDEAGKAFGITRERARQIINNVLRQAPQFDEDRLLPLVKKYEIDREAFCEITGCSSRAFNYLSLFRGRGVRRKGLSEALHDYEVEAVVRESIRSYLHKKQMAKMVEDNGEYVPIDRLSLVRHVLRGMERTACGQISADALYQTYKSFLNKHKLERTAGLLPSGSRALFSWMQRQRAFMAPRAASVRVYDFDFYDYSDLEEVWDEWSDKNIECSTALVFRECPSLMEALDIRDEYELYWLSDVQFGKTLDGVVFGPRMPMVSLGRSSRYRQILSLIEELSPVSTADLACEYECRYGVAPSSFKASFLDDFAQFKVGNGYAITHVQLNEGELAFLHEELAGAPYRSLAFVRGRFAAQFPNAPASIISDRALRELAGVYPADSYVISEGLIKRRDFDLPHAFHNIIYGSVIFSEGDDNLGHDVFSHSAFTSELNKALRAFDFIQCQENVFYSIGELRKRFGVSKENVRAYLDAVIAFVDEDVPFTIKSLRAQGFSHVVEILGEDERFGEMPMESILSSGSGSKRLSTSSICGKMIFCKTNKPFTTVTLLERIIHTEGELEIEELVDILEDEYGIPAFSSYVRQAVQRTSLVYKQVLDMVFGSEEDYRTYVACYLG